MPPRRLLTRKIREVLRLKHELGFCPHRAIAQACAIGMGNGIAVCRGRLNKGWAAVAAGVGRRGARGP